MEHPMPATQATNAATFEVDDIEIVLTRSPQGEHALVLPQAVLAREDRDGRTHRLPESFVDLLPNGPIWLRTLLPEDDVRGTVTLRTDGRPKRGRNRKILGRLVACAMCDAAAVPNGCKAIARFLYDVWTEDLASMLGPVPNARTVRLWRTTHGTKADGAVDVRSRRGRNLEQNAFHPAVRGALERTAVEAVRSGETAGEAHLRLTVEMEALGHPKEVGRFVPSLRTLQRRMRILRRDRASPSAR